MADIYFEHAIDSYIRELLQQMMYAYFDEIQENVQIEGPDCTDEDIYASLDRLIAEGFLQHHQGYYALGTLTRRDLRRWCE